MSINDTRKKINLNVSNESDPINPDDHEYKPEKEEDKPLEKNESGNLHEDAPPEDHEVQNTSEHVRTEKPYYVSEDVWRVDHERFVKPIEAGGWLGFDAIPVNKSVLWEGRTVPHSATTNREEFGRLLERDGIFILAAEKASSIANIQRMEQRFLRAGETDWFRKDNGELYMDNDIYENRMTKIIDVSLETNPALATKSNNAVLSERLNYHKSQYFKLDIVIGKLILMNHPVFLEEDRLAAEMKAMIKEYRERADLALIPYLHEMTEILNEEYSRIDVKEAEYALAEINRIKASLDHEVKDLQDLMDRIYKLWDMINDARNGQRFKSTNVRLLAREYRSYDNTTEVEFGIGNDEPDKNDIVPREERSRRDTISRMRVFVRIIINGNYVSRTRKLFVEWPSMEVNFLEKFQFYLFSKPTSIRLEVSTGFFFTDTIDSFEIEIPGERSATLTAASALYREVEFAKKPEMDNATNTTTMSISGDHQQPINGENGAGTEGNPKESGDRPKDVPSGSDRSSHPLTPKKREDDGKPRTWRNYPRDPVHGKLYYKAEWFGQSDKMPPESMHLGKSERVKKLSDYYSLMDEKIHAQDLREKGFHIDINDPRNVNILSKLKDMKTRRLKDHLQKDSFFPLCDVDSIRHRLLKMRQMNPKVAKLKIPILIDEIMKINEFLDAVKEQEEEALTLEKGLAKDKGVTFLSTVADVNDVPQSREALARVTAIRKILLKRQKLIKLSETIETTASFNIRAVVNEFYWEEKTNIFKILLNMLLTPRRKLRPRRKEEKKVIATTQKDCKISVHLIRGQNVPVRTQEAIKLVKDLKEQNEKVSNLAYNPFLSQSYMGGGMGGYNSGGYNGGYGGGFGGGYNGGYNGGMQQQAPQSALPQTNFVEIERVMSYIEVRLINAKGEEQMNMTQVLEGVHPEWNSQLDFNFLPKSENKYFTQQELINNTSTLYFTLFDCLKTTKPRRDNPNKATMTIEKHYLGGFSIPLISIFANPKINADFRVERPLFIFGYYNMDKGIFGGRENFSNDNPKFATTSPRIPTYVAISINLDPPLEIKSENEADYYPGSEDPQLLILGSNWLNDIRKDGKLARRYIKLWGETVKGQSVFLPRFITPLNPYTGWDVENDDNIYQKVARFVSLIPFKNDSQFFQDLPDIWCTCQEFIDLRAGDFEEHAILLCNYFTHIDQAKGRSYKSYILLGTAVPEGKTVYVLRYDKERNISEIWNPCTGDVFVFTRKEYTTSCLCIPVNSGAKTEMESLEPRCPLKSVGCLVNGENVWVNIQNEESPALIDFDVENPKKWQKFLGQKTYERFFPEKKIDSIQTPLHYEDPNDEYAQKMEIKIRDHLVREIKEARASIENGKDPVRTVMVKGDNSKRMKDILRSFESFKYASRKPGLDQQNFDDKDMEELKSITEKIREIMEENRKEFYGFPLNFSFVDLDRLWREVSNTGIQNIFDDDIQYTLSVSVYPYPNNILSVWIFVGVLFDQYQRQTY